MPSNFIHILLMLKGLRTFAFYWKSSEPVSIEFICIYITNTFKLHINSAAVFIPYNFQILKNSRKQPVYIMFTN